MGAWGAGHFDNDDACDWVLELEEAKCLAPAEAAIAALEAQADYLEAPEACVALAAAETIAATLGKPAADLPDSVADLISELENSPPELVKRAEDAVTRIARDSELRDLWKETDDFNCWQSRVSDLLRRLQ